MKRIITLFLVFTGISVTVLAQESKEKGLKAPDQANKEMSAKADVLSQTPSIVAPRASQDQLGGDKQSRRQARLMRRQLRMTRHKRLRHNFHHQHSLIKRR